MEKFFHSVRFKRELCKGCTHCINRCPTEAIRVRNGKALIIKERCIDCGECIRICPYHAKFPFCDDINNINKYKYVIALPDPALYGQFNNINDANIILNALKLMGFDDVYEVSRAAEIVADTARKWIKKNKPSFPVISSSCPTIIRLIRMRFPELIPNILPLQSPMEVAARMSKKIAMEKTGLKKEEIGTIYISPCAAKVTLAKMPLGTEKSEVDSVVAIKDIYQSLLFCMNKVENIQQLSHSGSMGIDWATCGGEARSISDNKGRFIAVDGIENVIEVLEGLEDEKFDNIDYVELSACSSGCVGGVLNVENPYIAKTKIKHIEKFYPKTVYNPNYDDVRKEVLFDKKIEFEPVLELDENIQIAMQKLMKMQEIEKRLSGIDCGSCGSPTCKSLAEDIVRGYCREDDCIFRMKSEFKKLKQQLEENKEPIKEVEK